MRQLVLKLHIYAGLLAFAQLIVYGIAGLAAFEQRPRPRPVVAVRDVPYAAAGSKTDREVAEDVYRTLAPPMTRPPQAFAIHRTSDNDLQIDFANLNGVRRVTVLEREGRLHVEEQRVGMTGLIDGLHTVTLGDAGAPRLVRLWGYYNEFAMWCLLGFCVSGVYLWLSAQARSWWAWACLAAGCAVMGSLWAAFR